MAPFSRRWPTTPIARGQVLLLAVLALLTIGAWVLTVHQARTMDGSMGVVARGGADPLPTAPPVAPTAEADAMADMDEMPGMATAAPIGTGMTDDGWTWDGVTTFVVAWAVMMAAMMFPAA